MTEIAPRCRLLRSSGTWTPSHPGPGYKATHATSQPLQSILRYSRSLFKESHERFEFVPA